MSRALRITGFALASLTIVTVALAQQSGSKGRNDVATQAVVAADEGKARLSRLVEPRRALTECRAGICDTPPKGARTAQTESWAQQGCGGDGNVARDRNGKPIRRICQSL
ncbi:MAG TPA: hypothetical protein VGN82_11945 [Bosea sp. (in: a-proteobacteria)]|jgi:hypothetical protein|uniref:hypothetical protein n=1 Tax=Bosea sp. (in: a-proteobacteria) TaxID=1871050 RepID=UPI002E0E291A|nr:hypothetical protein [Bosea sp. (in: a-proteobacteria)]